MSNTDDELDMVCRHCIKLQKHTLHCSECGGRLHDNPRVTAKPHTDDDLDDRTSEQMVFDSMMQSERFRKVIKAYTDKARIDELESIKVLNSGKAYCYKKDMLDGGDISVYNRIAQLKGDK
jgi:hypothetical protein